MSVYDQISLLLAEKRFCKIKRKVGEDSFYYSNGYILAKSSDFILMRQMLDFQLHGYCVFPISAVEHIRYNNFDRYFHKIVQWENLFEEAVNSPLIDLSNWYSVFRSIKKLTEFVIIENENPADETFDIGRIEKITQKAISIRYFDAKGLYDDELTTIPYDNNITIVQFDSPYINTFSKYLRERKTKR